MAHQRQPHSPPLPTPAVPEPADSPSSSGMTKFPAFDPDGFENDHHQQFNHPYLSPHSTPASTSISSATSPAPNASTVSRNGSSSRHGSDPLSNQPPLIQNRPGRQKSLGEVLHTIRTRRSSMGQNAQELAEALKPPVSPKLVVLCIAWYFSSIASNTSSKTILNVFPYPVTLTLAQFAFTSFWCVFLGALAQIYPSVGRQFPALKHGVRAPSRTIIVTTLPLTAFQIAGHILSSDATSRLPVSLVHTIKGLSPLFTVLFYRAFLGVQYNVYTYLSLIPLTFGVFLACSANFNTAANILGLLSAFSSTILFVTQNIVSKKLFNEAAAAEASATVIPLRLRKPDKLNLLCYSTGIAFIFTLPLWVWSEGYHIISVVFSTSLLPVSGGSAAISSSQLMLEFVFNGTCHFLQALVAFTLLSLVSPVTYSVGSLIKRVFVIGFAIVWFRNNFTNTQAFGIFLTFMGLYLYDRTSDSRRAPRFPRTRPMKGDALPMLPIYEKLPTPDQSSTGTTARWRSLLSPSNLVSRDPSPVHAPSMTTTHHNHNNNLSIPPSSSSSSSTNMYAKSSSPSVVSMTSTVVDGYPNGEKRMSDV